MSVVWCGVVWCGVVCLTHSDQLVLTIAYLVASLFIGIYESSIETIMICYLIDEHVNGDMNVVSGYETDGDDVGGGDQMLASDELRDLIGQYSHFSHFYSQVSGQSDAQMNSDGYYTVDHDSFVGGTGYDYPVLL